MVGMLLQNLHPKITLSALQCICIAVNQQVTSQILAAEKNLDLLLAALLPDSAALLAPCLEDTFV